MLFFVLFPFVLILYFIPWLVSIIRFRPRAKEIFFLNLYWGWSLVYWAHLLYWSFGQKSVDPPEVAVLRSTIKIFGHNFRLLSIFGLFALIACVFIFSSNYDASSNSRETPVELALNIIRKSNSNCHKVEDVKLLVDNSIAAKCNGLQYRVVLSRSEDPNAPVALKCYGNVLSMNSCFWATVVQSDNGISYSANVGDIDKSPDGSAAMFVKSNEPLPMGFPHLFMFDCRGDFIAGNGGGYTFAPPRSVAAALSSIACRTLPSYAVLNCTAKSMANFSCGFNSTESSYENELTHLNSPVICLEEIGYGHISSKVCADYALDDQNTINDSGYHCSSITKSVYILHGPSLDYCRNLPEETLYAVYPSKAVLIHYKEMNRIIRRDLQKEKQ